MLSQIFGAIGAFISFLILEFGYLGIFFVSFLENIIPPIPSEFVFPWAGYLAGEGKINIFLISLSGALGSTLAALILYYLGSKFNGVKTREFVNKYGKYFFISLTDLEKAEKWFEKYGPITILVFRVIPLARSAISVPAGFVKLNIFLFTFYTFTGTFIWSLVLTYLGFVLGENHTLIEKYVDQYKDFLYVLILIGLAVFLYKKRGEIPLVKSLFKK